MKPLPRVVRAMQRYTGQSGYDPKQATSELTPNRGLTVTWKHDRARIGFTIDPVGRTGLRVNLYHADERDPSCPVWYMDMLTDEESVRTALRTELDWLYSRNALSDADYVRLMEQYFPRPVKGIQ